MSDDLVVWLRAQLDEDERLARAVIASSPIFEEPWAYCKHQPTSDHVLRWGPARVLREVEARRRVLDDHVRDGNWCPMGDAIFRLLALPYSDRPGYRQEWAP